MQKRKKKKKNGPIASGYDDASPEGEEAVAEDPDSDGAADYLLNVGGDESHLRHEPQHDAGPMGVLLPADLCEVAASGDAEAEGQQLDEEAHERGPQQQPKKGISGDGAGLEIALEIAGIEEGDAHEESGAGEFPEFLPREGRHGDAGGIGGLDLDGVEEDVGFVFGDVGWDREW